MGPLPHCCPPDPATIRCGAAAVGIVLERVFNNGSLPMVTSARLPLAVIHGNRLSKPGTNAH
ncbi:hypothetical protein F9C07_12636 [Aspergillus flavus]|uniref:Uncharacterized protein n=1 Tax=Aspergillus flavus (strain ATCC 200026 / FGSC A1120 / IAM 13836 / NRRL 3357 / JCM 12722 / SRRC 167) TaxID=332952 RepID=A0A7U2N077_ASPFN|nr:hypothetical protein F9C07_12636 [Aspergillus flavus]